MKRKIVFYLFMPCMISIAGWGMLPPARRCIFPALSESEEFTAARIRVYKRKVPEPIIPFEQYISHEQFFINYVNDHVKAPYAQKFLDIALRLQRMIVAQETYFETSYWISNDGRDLRGLARELVALTTKRQYASLINDPVFMEYFTKYLTDRYSSTVTDQLRAAIPFGSWPGAIQWGQQILSYKRTFEEQWCKEISILQKWIDAGKEAQDNFYRDGILFLINALPDDDPLIMQPNSCIQYLRAYIGNRHPEILKALVDKGVEI